MLLCEPQTLVLYSERMKINPLGCNNGTEHGKWMWKANGNTLNSHADQAVIKF